MTRLERVARVSEMFVESKPIHVKPMHLMRNAGIEDGEAFEVAPCAADEFAARLADYALSVFRDNPIVSDVWFYARFGWDACRCHVVSYSRDLMLVEGGDGYGA